MKHKKQYPSELELKKLFDYDPLIGDLIWKESRGSIKKGSIAGSPNGRGYLRTWIDNIHYLNHLLIFIWMTGSNPIGRVDHDNGNTMNNYWGNLIEVSQSKNIHKARLRKDNTSGVKGVFWDERWKRYYSKIGVNKTQKWLGYFNSFEGAVAARAKANIKYYNNEVN